MIFVFPSEGCHSDILVCGRRKAQFVDYVFTQPSFCSRFALLKNPTPKGTEVIGTHWAEQCQAQVRNVPVFSKTPLLVKEVGIGLQNE